MFCAFAIKSRPHGYFHVFMEVFGSNSIQFSQWFEAGRLLGGKRTFLALVETGKKEMSEDDVRAALAAYNRVRGFEELELAAVPGKPLVTAWSTGAVDAEKAAWIKECIALTDEMRAEQEACGRDGYDSIYMQMMTFDHIDSGYISKDEDIVPGEKIRSRMESLAHSLAIAEERNLFLERRVVALKPEAVSTEKTNILQKENDALAYKNDDLQEQIDTLSRTNKRRWSRISALEGRLLQSGIYLSEDEEEARLSHSMAGPIPREAQRSTKRAMPHGRT